MSLGCGANPSTIPSELWCVIFGYAGETWAGLDCETLDTPTADFGSDPHFRYLCRSMTAGLEEWVRQGMEDRVKKDGTLRLAPIQGFSSNERTLKYRQRFSILAVTGAPREFLGAVQAIEGDFLTYDTSHHERARSATQYLIEASSNVNSIAGPFLYKASWIRIVDLTAIPQLRCIGNSFLACSSVEEARFPPSLECVGDQFLAWSGIKVLDLSCTLLHSVGDGFAAGSSIERIQLPSTLRTVGNSFLIKVKVERVDFSRTSLVTVGHEFLQHSTFDELLMLHTFRRAGHSFLQLCTARRIDLSETGLETLAAESFYSSAFEELLSQGGGSRYRSRLRVRSFVWSVKEKLSKQYWH